MVQPPLMKVHWESCLANPAVYKTVPVAEHTRPFPLLRFARSLGAVVCRNHILERFLRGDQAQRHSPAPGIYPDLNDSIVEIYNGEIYRGAWHWPQISKYLKTRFDAIDSISHGIERPLSGQYGEHIGG
jgi:hypothetical protein